MDVIQANGCMSFSKYMKFLQQTPLDEFKEKKDKKLKTIEIKPMVEQDKPFAGEFSFADKVRNAFIGIRAIFRW